MTTDSNRCAKYAYPCLSNRDLGFVRIGGAGLANCMFVASRAYILSKQNGLKFLSPTWRKLSIGPLLRHEKDKRVYNRLFNDIGIKGLKKTFILAFRRKRLAKVDGLGGYFSDLIGNYGDVKEYFDEILRPETVANVDPAELNGCVALHVRLGDYIPKLRIDINWYKGIIENLQKINPTLKFKLFSDGTDEELLPLTSLPNVEKAFFGNAFADMYAISKCRLLIASDSTFSAWGAFLGEVPIIFNRRHFPPVWSGRIPEVVIGDSTEIPSEIKNIVAP